MPGKSSPRRVSVYLLCAALTAGTIGSPQTAHAVDLASHKAIYDIRMKSSQTGSQVLDVRGKMLFTFKKSCDGWISNHKFSLNYEYTGSQPLEVESKFTSFEGFGGKLLNFSSSRISNGEQDQELRGLATISDAKKIAQFSIPEDLSFKLSDATLFPAAHTIKLIEAAEQGQKIVNAEVFDGSDDKGPVEINAVIGKKTLPQSDTKLDKALTGGAGWVMRLAVFPNNSDDNQTTSDYEMTMNMLENGVIKDMTVDYHNFSVTQKLVAIEPLKEDKCGAE